VQANITNIMKNHKRPITRTVTTVHIGFVQQVHGTYCTWVFYISLQHT